MIFVSRRREHTFQFYKDFWSISIGNQQSFHIQSPGPRKPSSAYQRNKMFL